MASTAQRFKGFMDTIPVQHSIQYLFDTLGKQGVKVVYEKSENSTEEKPAYERIMFGTFKRSCAFDFPGIIVDCNQEYKAISVPPAPPITKYKKDILQHHLKNANIIKAHDGTTVTLYYHNDKWVISTHRGYEVNTFIWFGTKTYEDVLRDVLENYPDFNYDALDKTKCYSIGFKHSEYHPFREGRPVMPASVVPVATTTPTTIDASETKAETKEDVPAVADTAVAAPAKPTTSAWFIRSVDLDKFNTNGRDYISYNDNIGLPIQERMRFNNMNDMLALANNAYTNYKTRGMINYGYLICFDDRNYLIESSLLRNIRQIFYTNRFSKLDDEFDKKTYIVVNAFLDAEKHDVFKTLFPQYNDMFKILEDKTERLVKILVAIIETSRGPTKFVTKSMDDIVAMSLYEHLNKIMTIKIYEKKAITNLLYTFICNVKYTNMFYTLAFSQR